ncbi:MAG: tetratricopeptide repeat protein, partial [Armatimonadota bacterium]|nr:tetratricopeptide repeat protein [Armatimonadota bacterium]
VEETPITEVSRSDFGRSITTQAGTPPNDLYQTAMALYEQGHYVEAGEQLRTLLTHEPKNTQAMTLLARADADRGRLDTALTWCEKAMAVDKLNPVCYYLRATILQEQGQLEDAVQSLKRALYLDSHFVLAHFALGNLARQQGKSREADKHLQNALQLLRDYQPQDVLPESEGITAGRLEAIITSMTQR